MCNAGIPLAMALALFAHPAAGMQVVPPAEPECPRGKPLLPPAYPPDLAAKGVGGTVLLALAIDKCGRVERAQVKESSGKKALDTAALASVDGVTLTATQRAKVVDGTVELPLSFSMDPVSYEFQKVDWPRSHRKPRYELEPPSGEFTSANAADQSFPFNPAMAWPSPYPAISSRFVQTGGPGQREFWLFIFKERKANVAAHYRPVVVDGEPVVKVSILCGEDAASCEQATITLLKGLPFAKARD